MHSPVVQFVLNQFGVTPTALEDLGSAGGFSGARLWRVLAGNDTLCLRRWAPEHPTPERLRFIHRVQTQAAARLDFVPALRKTTSGETYRRQSGSLWELADWMPGVADFKLNPSRARLEAALAALARFHMAVHQRGEEWSLHEGQPGLGRRHTRLEEYRCSPNYGANRILQLAYEDGRPELVARAERLVAAFWRYVPRVKLLLAELLPLMAPLGPCLRDIWHDHVLFTGDQVTGIVDFGAVNYDTVATDIARLLGSLVGDDLAAWEDGIRAYASVRPLSPNELRLIEGFDRSSVLMSGLEWLTWLLVERREFENLPVVWERIDVALARLEHPRHGGVSAGPRRV